MGFGDPDHQHPLNLHQLEIGADCFRCHLRIRSDEKCYGCTRCNHFVHQLCFGLPEKMRHPLHAEHTLTLFPSPSSQITSDCNHCKEPLLGGYTYSCQECLKFNLHLKCYLTLNLETKHHHPLRLCEGMHVYDCRICGLLIDHTENYGFACKDCNFFIHFDCTFIPPTVKHHHVHELTLEYNFPERSDMVYCDRCEDRDGKELDRTLSYYYCERCDYIAHVCCVTSQPAKVTTHFDHFVHEHPMIYLRNPNHRRIGCAACGSYAPDSFYLCSICNYGLHKSCAQFPRLIKHPCHKENHTLSLQSRVSQNSDGKRVCCELCSLELDDKCWVLQCPDCGYAVHLSCAREFNHPLFEGRNSRTLSFSSYEDTKFRCNACGELGDGFRMSSRLLSETLQLDLHLKCFALPERIDHGCHSHSLYLVSSSAEIGSHLSSALQCDICHTEADPELWIYCCEQCKYIAHLKCVVSNLLPAFGLPNNLSSIFSITLCEKDKLRVNTKPVESICSLMVKEGYAQDLENPVFSPLGFFNDPKPPIGDYDAHPHATDLGESFKDVVHCPKCELPISAQVYSSIYDWVHRNLKASIYGIQTETHADHGSLALLEEKVVDELYCPICNLLIFPPTYSCTGCQIYFHKSCAELPRKYTEPDAGHTFVLQSPSMNNGCVKNCNDCKRPFKGYAYFCTSCDIGFDVTCAMGAPLLKLENQKHSLYALCWRRSSAIKCRACDHEITIGNIYFRCGYLGCCLNLHFECAMLPSLVEVKRRIHHHPLVLEPHLDLSVDDYICDVCEKELNPCIWVYRCSDICGDRATFHVSCIVTSTKKKCHFLYDEECGYPHLDNQWMFGQLEQKMAVSALAAALLNEHPDEQIRLIHGNLRLLVDELEHEYGNDVTSKLMAMDQAEIFHMMEFPDALKAKVAETMKHLMFVSPDKDDDDVEEVNDE